MRVAEILALYGSFYTTGMVQAFSWNRWAFLPKEKLL
jgi:hypothetical protein